MLKMAVVKLLTFWKETMDGEGEKISLSVTVILSKKWMQTIINKWQWLVLSCVAIAIENSGEKYAYTEAPTLVLWFLFEGTHHGGIVTGWEFCG